MDLQAQAALRDHKETKGHRAHKDLKVVRDHKAFKVHREYKDRKGYRVHRECKGLKVYRDPKVIKVRSVLVLSQELPITSLNLLTALHWEIPLLSIMAHLLSLATRRRLAVLVSRLSVLESGMAV